jgi:hypothetical protein
MREVASQAFGTEGTFYSVACSAFTRFALADSLADRVLQFDMREVARQWFELAEQVELLDRLKPNWGSFESSPPAVNGSGQDP